MGCSSTDIPENLCRSPVMSDRNFKRVLLIKFGGASRMIRLMRMCGEETRRILLQPWFYLCVAGVFLIRFMGCFCSEYYDVFFVENDRSLSMLGVYIACSDDSYLGYASFCLCAFPVVGNFVQDYKSKRFPVLLPRIGKWSYAGAQVFVTIAAAAFCMFFGDVLCIIFGCFGMGLPFCKTPFTSEVLLQQEHYVLFFLFHEVQYCMQASFFALLTLASSIIIRDEKFIVTLPMIFRYFITCFFNHESFSWLPVLLSPKQIYYFNYGLFQDHIVWQAVYALFFTICVGSLVVMQLKWTIGRMGR